MNRTANSAPNDLQAACARRAMAQIRILMLAYKVNRHISPVYLHHIPHPFPDWITLKGKTLRILENKDFSNVLGPV